VGSYLAQNKPKEMEEQAQKEMEIYPQWSIPVFWHGMALKLTGNLTDALAAFQKATEMDPKHMPTWLALGRVYLQLGQVEKSIAPFQRATELVPESPDTWNCLGYANFLLGNDKEAIGFYNKAIACDKTTADAWINLARLYAKENDAPKVSETCDKIAEFNPTLAGQLRTELKVK